MSFDEFTLFEQLPPELQEQVLTYRLDQGPPLLNTRIISLMRSRMLNTLCRNPVSNTEILDYLRSFPNSFMLLYPTDISFICDIFKKYKPLIIDDNMITNDHNVSTYQLSSHHTDYIDHPNQEIFIIYSNNQTLINLDINLLQNVVLIDLWSMYKILLKRANCIAVHNRYAKNTIKRYLLNIYNREFNSGDPFRLINLYLYLNLNTHILHINNLNYPIDVTFDLTSGDIFDIYQDTRQIYTNVTLYNQIIQQIPQLYQRLLNEITMI